MQEAQAHLKFQSDFQKLFIGLATHLINAPSSQLDDSITEALRDIGLFLHTNRCTIQILDETHTHFSRAYEWHAPHAVSRLGLASSVENFPNVIQPLLRNEDFYIEDISQAPGLAEYWSVNRDWQAIAITPITRNGMLIGAISINWEQPASIAPDTLGLLRVLGEIYLNAMERKHSEEALRILNADLERRVEERTTNLIEQAKMIAAYEERQRLARDLHDSVTQTLFSANNIAEVLPQLLEANSPKVPQYVHDLRLFTRGAMAEMRSLLIELRPDALNHTQLGLLLAQLCDVFTGNTQIEVQKTINRSVVVGPEVKVVFYRVAQEAMNNIAKHAQAQHVSVDLRATETCIELIVRDDGVGFDPALVPGDGFGVRIMRERADDVQAEFAITSQPGSGTRITLRKNFDDGPNSHHVG